MLNYIKSLLVFIPPILTSCSSLNAIKRGDLAGVVSAPFELADNILDTTSVLEGREPKWSKRLPKTYEDSANGAKAVFPRGYNYGSIVWSGNKDAKGFADGSGTMKVFNPSGIYAFEEHGLMSHGKWLGNTTETDKVGKQWKCSWSNGEQTSRSRIYTPAELEQRRIASAQGAKRQKESLDALGRWLGNAMATSSGSGSLSSQGIMSCALCRDGRVSYEYGNIFGGTSYGSKPCERCNGTGWLKNGHPYRP